jgi:hypothetical protein
MASLDFDANTYEPNKPLDVIPPGEYDAIIVSSERKPTASGNGDRLQLELQIISGEHQNRKLFDNLNMWNKNQQALEIARATFSAICRAVNVPSPRNSEELHNKPLTVKVGAGKNQNGEIRSEVKGYKPRRSIPVHSPQAPVYTPATGQQPGKPW